MIKKLKEWILPKEIDFFKSLSEQSLQTQRIVEELSKVYTESSNIDTQPIVNLISESKKNRTNRLKELNSTFITPVDRESISRAYSHLYWVTLSIKHFILEMATFQIYDLSEYKKIFDLLQLEMIELTKGYKLLDNKDFESAQHSINQIIHLDNKLIHQYAIHLDKLFDESKIRHIQIHKELLLQLKEISKRIHICANLTEDIIFKMT